MVLGKFAFPHFPMLDDFHTFSTLCSRLVFRSFASPNFIRSGIEEVITRTTRNRLTGETVRGFESHPLRHKSPGNAEFPGLFLLPCCAQLSSSPAKMVPNTTKCPIKYIMKISLEFGLLVPNSGPILNERGRVRRCDMYPEQLLSASSGHPHTEP